MPPSDHALKTVAAYHEATKHTLERLYARPHTLDWANMPSPFRHYEGAPVLDLPADCPEPAAPALAVLSGVSGEAVAKDGAGFLSSLLYHGAAISATKVVPSTGYRYALRVNPSSGNLHPTEFHFAARGLAGWDDGLYHYRCSSHMAGQRMRGGEMGRKLAELAMAPWLRDAPLVFVLTSIAWREAWKYRERAYRYCLHDIGHAWESLALAARALGCEAFALGHFPDAEVARLLGLEDEWPMLLAAIQGSGIPLEARPAEAGKWFGGVGNRLSGEQVEYPMIGEAHRATSLEAPLAPVAQPAPGDDGEGEYALAPLATSESPFAAVVRHRRSALDFRGGLESISYEQLSKLLSTAARPFHADFEGDLSGGASARYLRLYLYIHRVSGMNPGIYRYWPESDTLECVRQGDQRVMAAGLSLGQHLAGNSCVTFSMVANLERAIRDHGARGYRYVFFEAGCTGQRLYVASEAMGFRSTGIGAFYDDQVHRYLDLEEGQVVYHFACGHAVEDPRLDAAGA
ncbi:MAG: SagB/ThcOx family dehydrogenase [Bryobacterales bacterium]|nr:SagB/ThcOx family dehydrogenase [Bryobacterales bacterium]